MSRFRSIAPVALAAALATTLLAGCLLEEPPPPTPVDEPGPHATELLETSFVHDGRSYDAVVYHPASSAGAPYPSVAFSHGACSRMRYYSFLTEHLASHGYVVIAYNSPGSPDQWCHLFLGGDPTNLDHDAHLAGLQGGLAHLAELGADPVSPLFERVDPDRSAILGHSWGAWMVLRAAALDSSIDAVVAIASWDPAASQVQSPSLILGGSLDGSSDCETSPGGLAWVYDLLPVSTDRQLVEIAGANHIFQDFDVPSQIVGDCRREIEFEDHQLRLARRYATAWLDHFLKGKPEAETYLTGDQAQQDVAAGLFTDFRYSIGGTVGEPLRAGE